MSLLTAAGAAVVAAACVGALATAPLEPGPTAPVPPPVTALVTASGPDPGPIIAAAGDPYAWVHGHGRVLLLYFQMRTRWWPEAEMGQPAVALVDRSAHVLHRWAPGGGLEMDWWPAGRGFVGMPPPWGRREPVLLRARGAVPLVEERGYRPYRETDVRFGHGWLLDPVHRTVTKEDLPRSRCARTRSTPSALTDLRGRTWCLDPRRGTLSWTDDGRAWTRHRLASRHFEYCDGGTAGAQVAVLGRQVAVGLWRADFSADRGRTWRDVDLPFELVGAHQGDGGSFPNCTWVSTLKDGRLVLEYFGLAVATSVDNTAFELVDPPARTLHPYAVEGVLVAPHRQYGRRLVSYDGGDTWRAFHTPDLLAHLFAS